MEKKARDTIAAHNMILRGDRIVAGISGGADSVALLNYLAGLRGELELGITAAHLNHMLRGEESRRDERFVRDFCEKLGVRLCVEKLDVADVAARLGIGVEEAGRRARYDFFSRLANEAGAKIATAHTLNDSAETAILNLARGTALRGLCGIPPVRGNIIRPLIGCERREVEEYCRDNGLDYVTDSSNLSDDFARNRIRRYVLPVLSGINPGFLGTAARSLESLRFDANYLDAEAERRLESICSGDGDCVAGRYGSAGYLSQDRAVRYRVLLMLLSRRGVYADYRRLMRLDSIIKAGSGAEQLADGLYLKAYGQFFCIGATPGEREYFCVSADTTNLCGTVDIDVFSDKKIRLMSIDYEYYEESIKSDSKPLKNALDCDKIDRIVKVRQKMPGDAVRLKGRGCTKTLKKLFQEAGIPPEERSGIFVMTDSRGPVWVEGFGAAERAAVTADTKRAIILDVLIGGAGNAQ